MATKTVGRYRRAEKIGYGNFGVVYKGVDTQTNRVVAIKTLDLDAVNDEVESVQHEVALLAHLSMAESSNVTKYYGTVLEGSKLWIVMDLCSGGSVRTLLRAGPLEDKYLSVIFRELSVAVAAIHAEGIIHRDIKAANVLITLAGQVKLCDFGVAAHSAVNQTKRHTIVGTPYWMAPEVITEGRSYTNKADIWSMGITFYEIVTGNPPYSEHEAMRALMLITNSRPPRLEGPKYTPSLKDLVALCLDEDPEARPSAEELLKHKFIKSYAKSQTSILRTLVERYVSWKSAHKGHRDSLLMFNPHEDNDDASIRGDDDDNDSVWDFNIEDEEPQPFPAQALEDSRLDNIEPEDMNDAPDSLRELFGVPARRTDYYPTQDATPMSPIPPVSQGSMSSPGPYQQSMPNLSAMAPPPLPSNPSYMHAPAQAPPAQASPAQASPAHFRPAPPAHAFPSVPPQALAHAVTATTPGPGTGPNGSGLAPKTPPSDAPPVLGTPDFGPRLRSHLTSHSQPHINHDVSKFDKPPLPQAPASVARQRSTTMGATGAVGSDGSALPPVQPIRTLAAVQAQAQAQVQAQSQAQAQVQAQTQSQLHSPTQLQPSPVPSNMTSPSPSPKRQVKPREPREALPRLQLPPRSNAKPMLMSASAGPTKQAAPGAGSLGRPTAWASEFPPMPKIDTNVLLDSTPDDIVVDHLLEITVQFKTAISSLAGQYDSERAS